jgi:hypothetical protein
MTVNLAQFDCSEDGRVIAIQQLKYYNPIKMHSTYDILVFVKEQFGKHQINLPEVHVQHGIQLNRDGSK